MAKLKIEAKERKIFGRKVKQLRKQGIIPANVFGPKTKSKAISVDASTFTSLFKEAGETSLVDLKIEGEDSVRPILISNIHVDPVSHEILHADLHQVDLKAKTTAEIPIVAIGEAPAAKVGGILVMLRNAVDAEALPTDLPEKIEVDVSVLAKVGDSILAKDLSVNRAKVTLEIDDEEPIFTIQEPEDEPEPEPEPAEGGDTEGGAEDDKQGESEEKTEDAKPDKEESSKESE